MTPRLPLALLPMLLACSTHTDEVATDPGEVRLCLATDPDITPVDDGSSSVWSASGTVEDAPAPTSWDIGSCGPDGATEWLTVRDADDTVWTIGWTVTADLVLDRSPTLDLAARDVVDLVVVRANNFNTDLGLIVRDELGLLFAAEEGYNSALQGADPADMDGLTVSVDTRERALEANGCGERASYLLAFQGDQPLRLGTWVQGTLQLGGIDYQARNVGTWSYEGDISCSDTWGPAPWIVYR